MSHVVERLKASRKRHEMDRESRIKADARKWAERSAEFDQLERFAEFEWPNGIYLEGQTYKVFQDLLDPEADNLKDALLDQGLVEAIDYDEDAVRTFIEAVQEWYAPVRDALDAPRRRPRRPPLRPRSTSPSKHTTKAGAPPWLPPPLSRGSRNARAD